MLSVASWGVEQCVKNEYRNLFDNKFNSTINNIKTNRQTKQNKPNTTEVLQ